MAAVATLILQLQKWKRRTSLNFGEKKSNRYVLDVRRRNMHSFVSIYMYE